MCFSVSHSFTAIHANMKPKPETVAHRARTNRLPEFQVFLHFTKIQPLVEVYAFFESRLADCSISRMMSL